MIKFGVSLVAIVFSISVSAQNSDSSSYYLSRGLEEKDSRRFREAEKHFAKALQFDPSDLQTLKEHAQSLLSQNRYAEAREVFLKAEKVSADDPVVIDQLTTLSFNLRKWDVAIKYANRNKTSPVNYIVGKSYYEQENYGEAMKFLAKAEKEEPNRADIPYIM
ncbi:MAG: tetratricopeptide repeat protein, partial [Flavitalea sp.]